MSYNILALLGLPRLEAPTDRGQRGADSMDEKLKYRFYSTNWDMKGFYDTGGTGHMHWMM